MIILSIETSCDDTGVAIVKFNNSKIDILSNILSSQIEIHKKYGGVYPLMAKREHEKNLPILFKKAIKKAGNPEIDLIAVTQGPGLEPCLWTGINFAEKLSEKIKKPIIPINHIEAHILINWLSINKNSNSKFLIFKIKLPAICLVVSGGHTQIILVKDIGKYKIIGETRDDAAGECFDKTARILGLKYPGGPEIASMASRFESKNNTIKLPRPMIKTKDYDFSFSGLKTAVLYHYQKQSSKTKKSKKYIEEMCHEIQQSIIDVLIHKTIKAAEKYKAKSIILGGGVSANKELKKQFKRIIKKNPIDLYIPKPELCTDNALMISVAAYFQQKKKNWKKIIADGNLKIEQK